MAWGKVGYYDCNGVSVTHQQYNDYDTYIFYNGYKNCKLIKEIDLCPNTNPNNCKNAQYAFGEYTFKTCQQ